MPSLETMLRRLRHRIRRVYFIRGALITAVTALVGLLIITSLDYAFSPLPSVIRWMCPLVWFAGTTAVGITAWWMPMRKKIELVRIARWLETRHSDLDERISTSLEITNRSGDGMSAILIDKLAKEAASSLEQVNPEVEVSNRRAKRWMWPAAAMIVVWGGLFIIWPDKTARHLVRGLNPSSKLGTAAESITVAPGSFELLEGDPLQITATRTSGAVDNFKIVLYLANDSTSEIPMEKRGNQAVYPIGKADRSFEYQIRSGRETSDRFRITVLPVPRLTAPRVRLEFPAYTEWPAREQALGESIQGIVGTKVELKSKLNTPVEKALLEINGETVGETVLQSAADGGSLISRWKLDAPGLGAGRISLKHRLKREFDGARFNIKTQPDAPPSVRWVTSMKEETRVRPDEVLTIGFEITDDIGFGTAELEIQPEHGDAARLPVDTPDKIKSAETPTWQGRIQQSVGDLVRKWPKESYFKLRMRVEDSLPAEFRGPGVGTSEWIAIRVDAGAKSLVRQEIEDAQSDARKTVEDARRLVREAREKIDQQKHELKKEEIPENSRKELAQAREKLADAREELEELAGRMSESVNAALADDVQKAAETIEQARQELENAPLQDTQEERGQSAEEAREQAVDAEKQLEKLQQEIQKSDPQLQEYVQLKELEQQQAELANQAESASEENPQAAPEPAWQQQQDQLAEKLKQQLQKQPEAMAEALKQQAEDAQALAEEASEQAAAQDELKQLSEAKANPTEALKEQLAGEQAEIAAEAQQQLNKASERQDTETANALPEAVEAAKDAVSELTQGDTKAAAESAEKAAAELKETAQESGQPELAALAEQQEKVAEAIAALDKGKPAEAKANPTEVLKEQLAQKQAEIAAEAQQQLSQASESQDTETANALPEAVEAAKDAASELAQNDTKAAAKSAEKAAAELKETAQESGQPELAALAEQQEKVAEAIAALDKGKPAEAAAALAEMAAQEAAALAEEIRETPQASPSGATQQAAQSSQQAAQSSEQAAQSNSQSKPAEAAARHAQSSQQFQQAAQQLDQAASQLDQQAAAAEAAAAQSAQPSPTPGEPMAEAFQQASEAADASSQAQATAQAQAAAQALAQAAASTLSAMQQGKPGPPGQPGQPSQPGQLSQPGESPGTSEKPQSPQASPGVPPELAKLGMTLGDWEKIKSSLKSDVASGSSVAIPEEYRDLVRRYFEQMSKDEKP